MSIRTYMLDEANGQETQSNGCCGGMRGSYCDTKEAFHQFTSHSILVFMTDITYFVTQCCESRPDSSVASLLIGRGKWNHHYSSLEILYNTVVHPFDQEPSPARGRAPSRPCPPTSERIILAESNPAWEVEEWTFSIQHITPFVWYSLTVTGFFSFQGGARHEDRVDWSTNSGKSFASRVEQKCRTVL